MSNRRPTQLRQRRNRIIFFWFRVLVSAFWWDVLIRNLGGRKWANRTVLKSYRNHARRFRVMAVELGGVMIKLGQFFASRVDILPKEIIDELSSLQDEVPPESFDDIREVLERELNRPLGDIFSSINPAPTGAASLGQVHHVVLKGGERAIVKVQRPGIEALVTVDLQALRTAAGWIKHYGPIRRRADIDALYDEFSRTLYQELDYLAEGRNIERFAADFKIGKASAFRNICVWGDFDVDGQTATTLLVSGLRDLGAEVTYHIPVRANESHGVNLPALSRLIDDGAQLLLTCDTGIGAHEAALLAAGHGVDMIITDHHDLPLSPAGEPLLPQALSVINPKLLPTGHPMGPLPGVGVAYKLIRSTLPGAQRSPPPRCLPGPGCAGYCG